MSAQKERRRSWGKTKHREVTVINREKIEETLSSIAEEGKKRKLISSVNTARSTGGVEYTGGGDLQFPELMSDEALVTALKRIKVPIPVYSDGRPSRERLLYLYKTNVMPRPQRKRERRLRGSQGNNQAVMEVDDWCANGAQTNRKRARNPPGLDRTEGISPAKKLCIDPSLSDNQCAVSPVPPSPTLAMGTLNLQENAKGSVGPMHRVVKLKRPAPACSPSISSTLGLSSLNRTGRDQVTEASSPGAAKKIKITWP